MKTCSWNFLEICKILVYNAADIDAQDSLGNTSLAQAVKRGYTELVKFLLQAGANPNITSKDNYNNIFTPLISACKLNNIVLVKILIEKGCDVNYPGNDYSEALFQCIRVGFYDGVLELLKAGVDLCGRNPRNRKTPLEQAIKFNQDDIASLIQENL